MGFLRLKWIWDKLLRPVAPLFLLDYGFGSHFWQVSRHCLILVVVFIQHAKASPRPDQEGLHMPINHVKLPWVTFFMWFKPEHIIMETFLSLYSAFSITMLDLSKHSFICSVHIYIFRNVCIYMCTYLGTHLSKCEAMKWKKWQAE